MTKSYYASRISSNIAKTPEGFLICQNVPIARTGVQDYLGSEIGMDSEKTYKVTRPEAEVFSKAAMASFEGKPVCDEHPDVDVDAANYKNYMKGIVRDVRRGTNEFKNCLMADFIIYDANLISAVENGKREISCGYDCLWVQTGDLSFEQRDIVGNHVAIVDKGRAGHKVAIRDQAAPQIERSKRKMSKQNLLERMFSAFCKDAEPGEILEASKLVNKKDTEDACAPGEKCPPAEKPAMDADVDARFKKIEDALEQLTAAKNQPAVPAEDADPEEEEEEEEPTALDALEEELDNPEEAGAEDEDAVTEDPQVINEAHDADPEEESDGDEPIAAPARDAALEAIRAVKPLIAQIKNPKQRKKAADSLAKMIRGQVRDEQYAVLMRAQRAGARRTNDSMDDSAYGKSIRDRFNPHYKNV